MLSLQLVVVKGNCFYRRAEEMEGAGGHLCHLRFAKMLRVQFVYSMVKVGFSDERDSQVWHRAACPHCTQLPEPPRALVPSRSWEIKGT